MRKVAVYILLVCAASFSVLAQASRTPRPRAGAPPPAINNDAPSSRERQPPVLKGDPSANPQTVKQTPAPIKDDQVITVETNLVTTPVSVLDRNGRFIPGLRKKDFKIFEDGVQQKITYFQSEEQPFTVVLMIDTSPSTKYHIDEIHFAAVTFVNQLRPTDKVMVVAFDQRFRVFTEPTNERQKMYAAIYSAQFGSGTSLYDAVDRVANLDLLNVPGRKAVVIFTDGVDTTSRRANYESSIAAVEEIDALLYPIRYNTLLRGDIAGIPGVQLPPGVLARLGRGQSAAEYEKGRLYLETLASNSGGRMFEAETITNLEESFAGVAEELRRQYSIGYYPDDTGEAGERRRIKIQVARPKVVVRAKTTYIIRETRSKAADPAAPGLQALNY